MDIAKIKEAITANKKFLEDSKPFCKMFKIQREKAKANIEKLEFELWKIESSESYENHKKVWENFSESGFLSGLMEDKQ